mmetsp:Transcript_6168/g.11146  ORF Transcript_6168/g.11146 Transcript_6168/m.11146 type:complete len:248 (-) Transcript_6168:182-925(-)
MGVSDGLCGQVERDGSAVVHVNGWRLARALHLNILGVHNLALRQCVFKHHRCLVARVDRDRVALALDLDGDLIALEDINCLLDVGDVYLDFVVIGLVLDLPLLPDQRALGRLIGCRSGCRSCLFLGLGSRSDWRFLVDGSTGGFLESCTQSIGSCCVDGCEEGCGSVFTASCRGSTGWGWWGWSGSWWWWGWRSCHVVFSANGKYIHAYRKSHECVSCPNRWIESENNIPNVSTLGMYARSNQRLLL